MTVMAVFLAGLVAMVVGLFIYLKSENTDYKLIVEHVKDLEADLNAIKLQQKSQEDKLKGMHEAIFNLNQAQKQPKDAIEVVITEPIRFVPIKKPLKPPAVPGKKPKKQ